MPQFYSSNVFALGWHAQGSFQTTENTAPDQAPTNYLRVLRDQTRCVWDRRFEQIRTGFGDIYGDSDLEEVNPMGTCTIVVPLTPTTLSTLLAAIGIGGGSGGTGGTAKGVFAPGLVEIYHAQGPVPLAGMDIYYNCGIQSVRFAASRQAPRWLATLTFTAGDMQQDVAYPGVGGPSGIQTLMAAYEKPYHLSQVSVINTAGGLGEDGTSNATTTDAIPSAKLESIQVDITYTNMPLFLGRHDARPRLSDFALVDIGAQVQFRRSYNSPKERDLYLKTCTGSQDKTTITLNTDPDCPIHSFGFVIPRGQYRINEVVQPDRQYMAETLTIQCLRDNAGASAGGSAPGTGAPIQFLNT
jgi:hypothetical protein